MSWSSLKKKREHSFYRLFGLKGIFFKICVLSQCIVHWIHFQNIHNFTHQKPLLHTLLLLVFKIVESLQCILNHYQKVDLIFMLTFYVHKIEDVLNKEFSTLCEWFVDNRLSIHLGEDKTKSFSFLKLNIW